MSSCEIARAKSSGVNAPIIESATFGPTPETVCTSSKRLRISSLRKPNKVKESSRTTSEVNNVVGAPRVNPELVAGLINTLSPTPPTSIMHLSLAIDRTVPVNVEIIYPRSFRRRDFSAATA
ncbi:unannotated protein [freshwater metagenome]|uniref:Unannotated protein n=1 Tax=freshwater metagenome TaxID=449393 RepID=A0A6J6BWV8_9ZZZZ